jgi:hypothetical protein
MTRVGRIEQAVRRTADTLIGIDARRFDERARGFFAFACHCRAPKILAIACLQMGRLADGQREESGL